MPTPKNSLTFDGSHFGLKITFDDEAAAAIIDGKQSAVSVLAMKFAADLESLLAPKTKPAPESPEAFAGGCISENFHD